MLFYAALMTLDEYNRDFVGQLYETHKKKIYEIAYSILKNRHDAEETVDEVMIRVINNVEKFMQSDGNEILAQLVIYSRNTAIKLYNAKKKRSKYELPFTYSNEDGENEDIDLVDDGAGVDEVVLSKLNSEIVAKEQEAALLVNPRPTDEEYVKYSFPSKTMEYMASGTPVLTTVLPGMPKEYHPYVYLLEDETADGIARKLSQVLAQSDEELFRKGTEARAFVLEQKNNVIQAQKILEMLNR